MDSVVLITAAESRIVSQLLRRSANFTRMQFDAYPSPPSFSDASSTPRTPSPNQSDFLHPPHINPKHNIPIGSVPHIFQESDLMIHNDPAWFPYSSQPNSLLQELYEHDPNENYPHDIYIDDSAHYTEWHNHQQHQAVPRRATFPYVRHDLPQPQYYDQFNLYQDPLSDRHDQQAIKLEDTPLIVPSQLGFPSLQTHHHPSYLPSPAGASVPVQLTDDAASKETQYLRRRCFNCHTTEPPSWRRSTLNPGKIVCNKCGLYERTHLRPRPLRFDELRAGGKTRKANAPTDKKTSKPAPVIGSPPVKNEPTEFGLTRRNSVSSTASSGASDWDDSSKSCIFTPCLPRIQTWFQFLSVPLSPLRLALPRRARPLSLLLQSRRSPSLAVPKAHLSNLGSRRLFVFPTHPSRILLPFNIHLLHRAKRRLHLIITHSRLCTRVSRTTFGVARLCSAVFTCCQSHLCPCKVSRQTLPYKRLRFLTHLLCCSPPNPFSISHPHNLTNLRACLSLDLIYCPCSRSPSPMLIRLTTFLASHAMSRLIYSLWLKTTTWHGQKSHAIYHPKARPTTSIDLYPLHRPHHDQVAHTHMFTSHTPLLPTRGSLSR